MSEQTIFTNLEYYKSFYYAAKCGTITAAAAQLCLTQPTVTNSIQRLEEQLGCVLFHRTRHGVSLTTEGRILWNRVAPACQLLLTAEQELNALQCLDSGSLSIATTEMSFYSYVLPVMEKFTHDYPKVKVRFRSALPDAIINMLRTGEIDLAILHGPFSFDEHMECEKIGKIEECFVAGPRYAFLAVGLRSLSELMDYPFISLPEGSVTHQFTSSQFQSCGLTFEPDMEVTTIERVIQAVRRNLGIAMLPLQRAESCIADGAMFRIQADIPPMEREAFVITNRDMPPGPAARTFLEEYLPREAD